MSTDPGDGWATDGKPHGTLRWFGPTWGAPVNDPANHIATPTDTACACCERPIGDRDQGVTVPHVYEVGTSPAVSRLAYHLGCWLAWLGIIEVSP